MIYAILYDYTSDAGKIAEHRPAHRRHLHELLARNQLLAAGPRIDDSGALIVYQAGSEAELLHLIESDPFHCAGVFLKWQVIPWRVVFGNRQLWPEGGPA